MALPMDPSTGKVDFIEFDSPVDLLQALLRQAGGNGLPVDKLGTVRIVNLTLRSSNTEFFAYLIQNILKLQMKYICIMQNHVFLHYVLKL